mmetsp:Transcript_18192/g.50633  ORF Transcript_18192/g.50633 Transcript_18192/m.50633 type:complete len:221 (+) Transcript_18192:1161-1823(+)
MFREKITFNSAGMAVTGTSTSRNRTDGVERPCTRTWRVGSDARTTTQASSASISACMMSAVSTALSSALLVILSMPFFSAGSARMRATMCRPAIRACSRPSSVSLPAPGPPLVSYWPWRTKRMTRVRPCGCTSSSAGCRRSQSRSKGGNNFSDGGGGGRAAAAGASQRSGRRWRRASQGKELGGRQADRQPTPAAAAVLQAARCARNMVAAATVVGAFGT